MTEKSALQKEIFDWIKTIGLAIILAAIINYFGGLAIVRGESMTHTLENKDVLVLDKITYRNHMPKRGDIIAFKTDMAYPTGIYRTLGFKKNLVKRVIGLPGDHIYIDEMGNVYRNDELLHEDYIRDGALDPNKPFDGIVPEGHIFVMGDNRLNSNDSRTPEVGYVPVENVIGRAFFRLFPFDTFGKL